MFVPWRDYCAALSTAYKVAQLLHLAIGWRWSLSQPFSVGQAFCEPAEFVLMIAMFLPHKPAFIYIGCLYLFFSQFPKQSINPAFKIFFGFFWCVCVCVNVPTTQSREDEIQMFLEFYFPGDFWNASARPVETAVICMHDQTCCVWWGRNENSVIHYLSFDCSRSCFHNDKSSTGRFQG